MIVSEARRRAIVALWESGGGCASPSAHGSPVAPPGPGNTDESRDLLRKNAFCSALAWVEEGGGSKVIGSSTNRVVWTFSFDSSRRMAIDPCHVLECDPSRFQPDEHASRGYHDALLWAKGSTTHKDECLSLRLLCTFVGFGIFRREFGTFL